MGGSALNNLQQNIRDHEEDQYDDDQFDDLGFSSSSSDDDGSSSTNSSSSDLAEDATTTTTSPSSSIADHDQLPNNKGPLDEMSSLIHQLPFKRGLSKFYQGKSQSFTSLSNVRSLEDLAKPENPYNKRLKSCRSYGGLFISENHHQKQSKASSSPPKALARAIAKKSSSSSRVSSCSSLSAKRSHSFLGLNNRPPIAPQKNSTETTLCNQQTPLFV
ncbi:hypothetical protein Sjap_014631 [Stephania japonica]|uniref:Oxidative stress 3 n=1 Tax=Stephania japonica TaxID=461633 RepID=A0AAP0IHM3_9MAGN